MSTPANTLYIRLPEVRRRTGLSTATIYRKIDNGTFPSQVRLSLNIVAWREYEIARWCAAPMDWGAKEEMLLEEDL